MEQDCSRKTVRIVYYIAGTENVIDKHIPRNLLDNLTHKSSPLAEVALRSRNTGLDDSCLGFLHTRHTLAHRVSCNEVRILPCVHIRVYLHCTTLSIFNLESGFGNEDPPRGETGYLARLFRILLSQIRD